MEYRQIFWEDIKSMDRTCKKTDQIRRRVFEISLILPFGGVCLICNKCERSRKKFYVRGFNDNPCVCVRLEVSISTHFVNLGS